MLSLCEITAIFVKQEPISNILDIFVRFMRYFVYEIVVWLAFDCDAGHLSEVCNFFVFSQWCRRVFESMFS